jgi:hypothetical protein
MFWVSTTFSLIVQLMQKGAYTRHLLKTPTYYESVYILSALSSNDFVLNYHENYIMIQEEMLHQIG